METKRTRFVDLNTLGLLIKENATTFTFNICDGVTKFKQVENPLFSNNLILVDGLLSNILAEIVLCAYSNNCSKLPHILTMVERLNPLNLESEYEISFYTYKVKELLRNLALGMNTLEVWNGPKVIYDHFPMFRHQGKLIYYSDSDFIHTLFNQAIIGVNKLDVKNFNKQEEELLKLNLHIELPK